MGLTQVLAALAVRRVHVLLVEVPGWWSTRVRAQQELAARGWQEASSPADADVLLVCGDPGEALRAAVAVVWEQLPGPRVEAVAGAPDDVAGALDRAATALTDTEGQRADARRREEQPGEDAQGAPDADHEDMDHRDMDHDKMDHGDMDHGGMDHGDMDMAPGGIPLAGGGEDRDGLEMDVLHVPLGPVLQHWPAGLVLRCTLQGDVVVEAQAEVLPAGSTPPAPEGSPRAAAARLCDQARQVLELAGWGAAAARAGGVRDELLAGADLAACRTRLDRLLATVARSRLLRWSLRDLGRGGDRDPGRRHRDGLPAFAGGDVHDRLVGTLRTAGGVLDDHHPATGTPGSSGDITLVALDPQLLPALVTGLELASVRLVVAGLAQGTVATDHAATTGAGGG